MEGKQETNSSEKIALIESEAKKIGQLVMIPDLANQIGVGFAMYVTGIKKLMLLDARGMKAWDCDP